MQIKFDKILGCLRELDEGTGGGGTGDTIITGTVATYAELPLASAYTGKYYIVDTTTGTWILGTKKSAGIYKSNGTTWIYIDSVPETTSLSDGTTTITGTNIILEGSGGIVTATDINNNKIVITGPDAYTKTESNNTFEYKLPSTPVNPETKFLNANKEWSDVSIGNGGYSANLYFTTDNSDISGYYKISYSLPSTETELTGVINNQELLLRTYLYDEGLGLSTIDSGNWVANFTAKVSSGVNVTQLKAEVFLRHSDNSETTLFSAYSPEINNTDYLVIRTETNQPSFSCLTTDRLGIKVYGKTTATENITISTIVGDGRASYFSTPLRLRHSQLRDLNSDNNYLHVTSSQVTTINNTSGTNTGDETQSSIITKLDTALSNKYDSLNFISGADYLEPDGNGSQLTSLTPANINYNGFTSLTIYLAEKTQTISPNVLTNCGVGSNVYDDALGEFNTTTGEFIPKNTGVYSIFYSLTLGGATGIFAEQTQGVLKINNSWYNNKVHGDASVMSLTIPLTTSNKLTFNTMIYNYTASSIVELRVKIVRVR